MLYMFNNFLFVKQNGNFIGSITPYSKHVDATAAAARDSNGDAAPNDAEEQGSVSRHSYGVCSKVKSASMLRQNC